MVHCRKGSCNLAQLGSQYPGWKLRSNLTSITSITSKKTREKCYLDPSGSVYLAEKSVNCGFLMMRQIRMSAMESVTIPCKNASSAAKKGTNSKEALQGGDDGANPAFN
uniref:Uncharacterized protein n=1 Tax=Caenorhabditis japonica TaxID=281687 RepID=A0A8R1EK75_CAEJA